MTTDIDSFINFQKHWLNIFTYLHCHIQIHCGCSLSAAGLAPVGPVGTSREISSSGTATSPREKWTPWLKSSSSNGCGSCQIWITSPPSRSLVPGNRKNVNRSRFLSQGLTLLLLVVAVIVVAWGVLKILQLINFPKSRFTPDQGQKAQQLKGHDNNKDQDK